MINLSSISGTYYNPRTRGTDTKSSLSKSNDIAGKTTEEAAATDKVKNTSSLPDKVFENIQRMAKEDAKKGIYMDNEFVSYINTYKKQNISPNRSKLMTLLNPLITNARYTNGGATFFSLQGFTVKYHVDSFNTAYMSVRDNSGQQILSYTPPPGGGWVAMPTKEENQFYDEATAVYYEAYSAARAEIKAQAAGGAATAPTNGFSVTV